MGNSYQNTNMTVTEKDILIGIYRRIWDSLPEDIRRDKIWAVEWLPDEHRDIFLGHIADHKKQEM